MSGCRSNHWVFGFWGGGCPAELNSICAIFPVREKGWDGEMEEDAGDVLRWGIRDVHRLKSRDPVWLKFMCTVP